MTLLRPYQLQGLAAFRDALSPDVNRVALEMATGLGKTVLGAQAAVEFLDSFEGAGNRVLVLVPTDEICQQWVAKLSLAVQRSGQPWTIGVVKAERNEPAADIVVASIATLVQPGRKEQITGVGFVIVDEAHHAVTPSCMTILEHYGVLPNCDHAGRDEHGCWDCRNTGWLAPPVPSLGLSATLRRTDGQGLGRVWQEMPFSRNLSWAIRKGYLIDLVPYTIKIPELDTSTDATLDTSLADGIAPEAVVQAWLEHRNGPGGQYGPAPSTVLFAPLVKSAQAFADAFNSAGVKAEVVHGKMADAEVAAVMARYEAGVTTVVCNAMKLTEGWDSPRTMCVIWTRKLNLLPDGSVPPLFIQGVGRGLRPWLSAEAPPREDQRCIVFTLSDGAPNLATVADLSENAGDVREGESFLEMEDRWDLGQDIPEDESQAYRGPVRVERWDPLVQASSKAWKYTAGGVPFLPTAKRTEGYVFLVERAGAWEVWARERREVLATGGPYRVSKLATAPDIELAMAVAEDEAQERGGDVGALLADKGRPWRKGRPTDAALAEARRELDPKVIERIMSSKAGGKAGKLSDRIDIVKATRVLDRVVGKIKERGSKA
jgi:superfamily II DNA or RNA helicase